MKLFRRRSLAGASAPRRIVCAITHSDEITLELCRAAIERQTMRPDEVFVVSGVAPASDAFNLCLDRALELKANVLVHVAADCLLSDNAVASMVARIGAGNVYAVTARGFDMMNGEDAPIGAWALNMDIIGDRFRFRDVFKMDLDFCDRIEAETGATRRKTKRGVQLGYHHPIWLAGEMYQKFRYNAPKYSNKEIRRYNAFLKRCLAVNPDNKVLRTGLVALRRGAGEPHALGGPVRGGFDAEWEDVRSMLELDGSEFFAFHEDFVETAHELVGAGQPIVPMAGRFFSAAGRPSGQRDVDPVRGGPLAPLRSRLGRALRTGRTRAKDALRPLHARLPQNAQNALRRLRGLPVTTPAERRQEAQNYPHLRYGAMNEGRPDWASRWDAAERSRRVLLVAPKDFAGSMFKWAEALNAHTDVAARLVTFQEHQYGYPQDLIIPECDDARLASALSLADEAGVLHLKDEHSWFLGGSGFTNLRLIRAMFFGDEFASVPKVFTHYGGYARKFKAERDYVEAVRRFDGRVAMTPDLNFPWFEGAYIPHTIDVEAHGYGWTDSRIFAHSPSSPEKKATYLFEETVEMLPRLHPRLWEGWSVELISGVSFEECMRRKRAASLFFDQAGRHRVADLGIDDIIGWYGNSAIEAMAFGIPTMAHLSDTALAQAAAAGVDTGAIPVINIERTRAAMIDAFVAFAGADPEARAALSRRTRAFTEAFHGYAPCARRLAALYRSVSRSTTESSLAKRKVS